MRRLIIEHLKATELPEDWAKRLNLSSKQRVKVSIDIEKDNQCDVDQTTSKTTPKRDVSSAEHPSFGMWRDRTDMEDPVEYVRKLRAPRYPFTFD